VRVLPSIGNIASYKSINEEYPRLQYTVQMPVDLPRKMNPIISMQTFKHISQVEIEILVIDPRIVERPVIPPVTKRLGTKKKYVAHAIRTIPTFINIQFLNLIIISS
jgi:hypothetical protein